MHLLNYKIRKRLVSIIFGGTYTIKNLKRKQRWKFMNILKFLSICVLHIRACPQKHSLINSSLRVTCCKLQIKVISEIEMWNVSNDRTSETSVFTKTSIREKTAFAVLLLYILAFPTFVFNFLILLSLEK